MVRDLFVNAAILIAFVGFSHQILLRFRFLEKSLWLYKVTLGVLGGLLGITLILFSVRFTPVLLVDFRNVALIISGVSGGPLSVVISGLMILGFRLGYSGLTPSSLSAAVVLILLTGGVSLISIRKLKAWKMWLYSVLFALAVSALAFARLIPDPQHLQSLLSAYCTGTIIVSALMYSYLEFLKKISSYFFQIKDASSIDFLTGLLNLRHFSQCLTELLDEADRDGKPLSILMIDIDHFKRVNDTFGHPAGDEVLKEVARLLVQCCRSTDIISRNGGEEFSIMLPTCSAGKAYAIAEILRKSVETQTFSLTGDRALTLTVSIGVATYLETTFERSLFLHQADDACFAAKRAGRNTTVIACSQDTLTAHPRQPR